MQELSDETTQTIASNLAKVRQRIAVAAEKAGRSPEEVTLVAVTKTQPPEVIPFLLDQGVKAIGESRPEVLTKKQLTLNRDIPWHMIGHFQRKKIRRSLPHIQTIHSIHNLTLLSSIDHAAGELAHRRSPLEVMIQVNVAEEQQKQGISVQDAKDVCDIANAFNRLKLVGLMTMAPQNLSEEDTRAVFRRLKDLRNHIGTDLVPELSMGMSQDFELAIEEGATIVRIGSLLFDGLEKDR